MTKRTERPISSLSDLLAREASIDRTIAGITLGDDEQKTGLAEEGAHDPTPTPYFILDELFRHYSFSENSHLLDVGCGMGRVLAYFVREGFPGRATGVELDPLLASTASSWASRHPNLRVLCASALDLDLSPYTDFYLFNPFDPGILQQFIEALERQVARPCTLVHMSDNGDTWRYVGRPGWTEVASDAFEGYRNARGYTIKVYDCPQHYTVWHYDGNDACSLVP